MNFDEIKKTCPKAWKEFIDFYYEINSELDYKICEQHGVKLEDTISAQQFEFLSGWLDQFFDEQGIRPHVCTSPNGTFRPYLFKKSGEVWTFLELEEYEYGFEKRKQAKQAAFAKAFEILEDK